MMNFISKVLVPSWGFLYINTKPKLKEENVMTNVLVPSWGFLYINCKKRNGTSCTGMFSSPRGDFFILTKKQ